MRREVGLDLLHLDSELLERGPRLDKRRVGSDDQIVAVLRRQLGDFEADAARSARDDGEFTRAHLLLLLFLLGSRHFRLQDDLGVGILFVVPVTVHLGRLLERRMVGNQEGRVDLAFLDHLEQGLVYFWTWVWPCLSVRPFSINSPSGNLSAKPP